MKCLKGMKVNIQVRRAAAIWLQARRSTGVQRKGAVPQRHGSLAIMSTGFLLGTAVNCRAWRENWRGQPQRSHYLHPTRIAAIAFPV
jgi:hypothetical protein